MRPTAWLLLVPLAIQALAMFVDELHFHRKRGLGAWERIGHPLDTITVLSCLGLIVLVPPTSRAVAGYVLLALFSCAFVTKDEAVHARRCSAGEHWLHALLFVLHPICLASLGLLWPGLHHGGEGVFAGLTEDTAVVARLVPGQLVMTSAFCLYQILYWNLPWLRRPTQT